MLATQTISQILGPLLFLGCLAVLANYKVFKKMVTETKNLHLTVFFLSMFRTLVGLVVIAFHNVRAPGEAFLVTFVGWLCIAVGTLGMFLPEQLMKALPSDKKHGYGMAFAFLIVGLILGLLLTYVAFFGA